MSACAKPRPSGETCAHALAGGWILFTDMCPVCTSAAMDALEKAGGHVMRESDQAIYDRFDEIAVSADEPWDALHQAITFLCGWYADDGAVPVEHLEDAVRVLSPDAAANPE